MPVLQLVQQTETNMIPYDEGVAMGKKIISEIEDRCWQLGDLSNDLEPKYGDQTLQRFAIEIGVNYRTLKSCRGVARSWPKMDRVRSISFETAKALMGQSDRVQIALDNPHINVTEARRLARSRQKPEEEEIIYPYQEPCTDCNTAEEQWQRSVANLLGDILTFRAYWDRLFGEEWKTYKIPSSHIKLAMDAKKEFIKMVALFKEHPRDSKN